MRWLLLVLLLAGCLEAPEPRDDPAPQPAPSDEPPPAVVDVLRTAFAASLPGGQGSIPFDVPAGYQELFVATPEDLRIVGDVRLALVGPSGEHVLLEGTVVLDEATGAPTVGGCGECTFRVPAAGGAWTLDWSIDGEIDATVVIEAL